MFNFTDPWRPNSELPIRWKFELDVAENLERKKRSGDSNARLALKVIYIKWIERYEMVRTRLENAYMAANDYNALGGPNVKFFSIPSDYDAFETDSDFESNAFEDAIECWHGNSVHWSESQYYFRTFTKNK